jgi:hypothetical protein
MDAPQGLTKLVLEPESGQILGIGTVGRGAEDLVAEGVLTIEMEALAEDLALGSHIPTRRFPKRSRGRRALARRCNPHLSLRDMNRNWGDRCLFLLGGNEQVVGVLFLDDISTVEHRASGEVLQAITE